jgi:ribosomal protein L28
MVRGPLSMYRASHAATASKLQAIIVSVHWERSQKPNLSIGVKKTLYVINSNEFLSLRIAFRCCKHGVPD